MGRLTRAVRAAMHAATTTVHPRRWRLAWQVAANLGLAAVLIAVCVSACMCKNIYTTAHRMAYTRLQMTRDAQRRELLAWYKRQIMELSQVVATGDPRALFLELREYGKRQHVAPGGRFPVKDTEYTAIIRRHLNLNNYAALGGHRDIYLIDAKTGQVVYSVKRDTDNGANLNLPPYAKTGLAECWRTTCDYRRGEYNPEVYAGVVITDFGGYPEDSPGFINQFIGMPLWPDDPPLAVIVVQTELEELDRIMGAVRGLGTTGQAYLTASDGLVRNNTRRRLLADEDASRVRNGWQPRPSAAYAGMDANEGRAMAGRAPTLPIDLAYADPWYYSERNRYRGLVRAPSLDGPAALVAYAQLFPGYGEYEGSMASPWLNLAFDEFWEESWSVQHPQLVLCAEQQLAEIEAPARKQSALVICVTALVLLVVFRLSWLAGLRMERIATRPRIVE